MNLMRTTRIDNLNEVNRIDSIKRRKANEPAKQTVIHEELEQKPSRVEIHSIEPMTTTKSSLAKAERLLESAEQVFLPEALERTQHVQGTKVTIGESVRQTVTKAVGSKVATLAKDSKKEVKTPSQDRYEEVIALYQATYQPNERIETTSIFA